MKIVTILCLMAATAFGQAKDTVRTDSVQITLSVQQYKELINVLDQNIDSKSATRNIVEFIQQHLRIIADKPKKRQ